MVVLVCVCVVLAVTKISGRAVGGQAAIAVGSGGQSSEPPAVITTVSRPNVSDSLSQLQPPSSRDSTEQYVTSRLQGQAISCRDW